VVELTETVKAGDWEIVIKRYTLKERTMIQARALNSASKTEGEQVVLDLSKANMSELEGFIVDSILYGIKSVKYKGEEVQVTREFVESLDHELATFLFNRITEFNNKRFFLPEK
jgi:hypothetical protein